MGVWRGMRGTPFFPFLWFCVLMHFAYYTTRVLRELRSHTLTLLLGRGGGTDCLKNEQSGSTGFVSSFFFFFIYLIIFLTRAREKKDRPCQYMLGGALSKSVRALECSTLGTQERKGGNAKQEKLMETKETIETYNWEPPLYVLDLNLSSKQRSTQRRAKHETDET